ncbi:MAG: ATP-binding protein [Patescibacteria group bacterium]
MTETAQLKLQDTTTIYNQYSYTFSSAPRNYSVFLGISYMIQKYLKEISDDFLVIKRGTGESCETDYNKREELYTDTAIVFTYNKHIYYYSNSAEIWTNTITSNVDITQLVNDINKLIKYQNPWRNKNIYLDRCTKPQIKKPPCTTIDQVVLPKTTKEDILDNTLYHLQHLEGNNGIILYGPPGTGKSLIASAIISEALKQNFNTAFLTEGSEAYEDLNIFIETFLDPCIVIFEDIDTLGSDRKDMPSMTLSSFLQFMNGLSEQNGKRVVIATTNYLEYLDKAIKNRPARFNRLIKFDYPSDQEINDLMILYFDISTATQHAYKCCNLNFTGSHIKELKRTTSLLSKKHNKSINEVFDQALDIIKQNFPNQTKKLGL